METWPQRQSRLSTDRANPRNGQPPCPGCGEGGPFLAHLPRSLREPRPRPSDLSRRSCRASPCPGGTRPPGCRSVPETGRRGGWGREEAFALASRGPRGQDRGYQTRAKQTAGARMNFLKIRALQERARLSVKERAPRQEKEPRNDMTSYPLEFRNWSDHVVFKGGPQRDLSIRVYGQRGPGRWAEHRGDRRPRP